MRCTLAVLLAALSCVAWSQDATLAPIYGITFAGDSTLYAPVRDLATDLGLPLGFANGVVTLAGIPVKDAERTPAGTTLIPIRNLTDKGATIVWDSDTQTATISFGEHQAQVVRGAKRVVVDQTTQTLEAYQGDRLVLETHISTGRRGHETDNGAFEAGPVKERMHHSRLYDNAPMPWSVQVDGDVFIHGYTEVPSYPASHGCIRVPLDGANPAHWFFRWVDVGTPVTVQGEWRGSKAAAEARESKASPNVMTSKL